MPHTVRMECLTCNTTSDVPARNVTVQVADYAVQVRLSIRCPACHRVTASGPVPMSLANRLVGAGARFRKLKPLPAISEQDVTQFVDNFDKEMTAILG